MTTPHETLDSVQSILSASPTGAHSCQAVTCPHCAAWWQEATRDDLTGQTDDETRLAELAAALPPAGHPVLACTGCDGCLVELEIAMDTVALASAGVNPELAWGPLHTGDDHDSEDWLVCQTCTQWVHDRRDARTRLTDAGLDPVRWLGPDDTPV